MAKNRPAVKALYCDESGYTGSNMLDANQPIFVIASTDLEPGKAEVILRQSFPRYQGHEFKFSKIWRSKARHGLFEFSRSVYENRHHACIWMIDKRFAVLTKIVDFLIEPWLTESGYDFYGDGYCWKYSNFIYFALQQYSPPGTYELLLEKYQTFSRNPSTERLGQLRLELHRLGDDSEGVIKLIFEQMSLGADLFTQYHDIDTFRGSNELQLSSMFAVVAEWRQLCSEDFIVFHDASANFFRRQNLWAGLTDPKASRRDFPLGDGTTVEFPLRVQSTKALDSRSNRAIQFCDVLAGLVAKQFDALLSAGNRRFLNDVIESGVGSIKFSGIRPEPIFPSHLIPKRLTGPDSVDLLSELLPEHESAWYRPKAVS